jgi:hypothetical protein
MGLVGELNVVGDEQIQIAVLVDVQKIRAGPDLPAVVCLRLSRHVAESPVAVVSIQDISPAVVQVEVQVPVVVVITGGNSQSMSGITHADLPGHVGLSFEIRDRLEQCLVGEPYPTAAAD